MTGKELIRKLNRIPFVGLHGIRVGEVLAVVLWQSERWTKQSVENIEYRMIRDYSCETAGERPDKAFVFSDCFRSRSDQLLKFRAVEGLMTNKLVLTPEKERRVFNPYARMASIWYLQMSGLGIPEVMKKGACRLLCAAMGYGGRILSRIEVVPTIKKVILFSDISYIDTLLVQKCNQKGLMTYTLQHGIINGSYDYIEYRYSHADYFLAWGEYTKRLAIHYGMPESKIKVTGNINQLIKPVQYRYRGGRIPESFLVCTNGVLDQDDWNNNKNLIRYANRLAEEYGLRYCLKIHPCDNIGRYRRLTDDNLCLKIIDKNNRVDISDALFQADFLLCGNSTTFCDAVYWGVPAFRYIAEKDRRRDSCKGISFGRAGSYEELKAQFVAWQTENAVYQRKLEAVRNFLFASGDIAGFYINAIENQNTIAKL